MESDYESDYDGKSEYTPSKPAETSRNPIKGLPVEALEKDIVGLILQYLENAGYNEAVHALEKEAQYYFDLKYFKQLFINGQWIELLNYLKGFISKEENTRFYFEILRHKFFDALDRGDKSLASKILKEEFWPFYELDENNYDPNASGALSFNEWASLIHFDDFRKHPTIRWTKSAKDMRVDSYAVLEKYLTEKVPKVSTKVEKPTIPDQKRLRTLLNQAITLQVKCCVEQNKPTTVNTLFVDHKCNEPSPQYGNYCFDPATKKRAASATDLPAKEKNNASSTNNNANNSGAKSSYRYQGRGPASPIPTTPGGTLKRGRSDQNNNNNNNNNHSQNTVTEYEPPAKKRKIEKTNSIFPQNFLRADITWPEDYVPDVVAFHPKFSGILVANSKNLGLSFVNLYKNKQILIDNQIIDNDKTPYNSRSIIWSADGKYFATIPTSNQNEIGLYEFSGDVSDNFDETEDVTQAKFKVQKFNSIRIGHKIHDAVIAMLPFNERTKWYLIVAVDNAIIGYDIENRDMVWRFEGHEKSATQLCMMNYEHLPVLLSVSNEYLYVWMFPSYDPITTPLIVNKFACFKAPFACHAIGFSGGRLFACSKTESSVVELDYVQGTIMRRFHSLQPTNATQLSVTGRIIVSNSNHSIKFWSTESNVSASIETSKKIEGMALSCNGKYLAVITVGTTAEKTVNIYSNEP